jgi:hypothetical protein
MALLISFLASVLLAIAGPARAASPNLVFILVDDLDVDTFAALPELRPYLQDAGMTFDNGFVSLSSWSASSTTT